MTTAHSVRMLSPPYSPHADMTEMLSARGNAKQPSSLSITLERRSIDLDTPGNISPNTSAERDLSPTSVDNIASSSSTTPTVAAVAAAAEDSTTTIVDVPTRECTARDQLFEYMSSDRELLAEKRLASSAFESDDEEDDSSSPGGYDSDNISMRSDSPGTGCRRRERRMTTCWDALKTNPPKYLRQERNLLGMYPFRRHSWAGVGSAGMASDDSDRGLSVSGASRTGSGRGPGRRAAGRSSSTSGPSGAVTSGRGRRRTPPFDSNGLGDSSFSVPLGEDGGRGSSGSQVRVHDLSLHQIEDYAPPLSSLPPGKSLRAEWKGAPMDLSNDPELHLLHPAEAHLASVLRLPCEVYLDSKRRLFAEKVHRLRQGLPFRRTDSQKACRIDVNKASRLFGAFEKIGWLADELFTQYLD